jgi:hypothetical protein
MMPLNLRPPLPVNIHQLVGLSPRFAVASLAVHRFSKAET